jgi:hypothetical protein
MASEINTNNIDTEYPRAGEDNPTQGLRDNFVSIKENIDTAKTEIEDLQDNTARTDELTNFNGSTISNAGLRTVSQETIDIGNIDQDTRISFADGSYQTITVNNNVVLTFSDWPETGKQASIWLEISRGDNLNLNPTVIIDPVDSQEIKYDGKWSNPFLLANSDRTLIVEISSADNGNTLYVSYHGAYNTGFDDSYDIRNLLVTNDVAINGNLTVNGSLQVPDVEIPVSLDAIEDVAAADPADKEVIRYNANTEQWESVFGDLVNIEVSVIDNGTGTQDEFHFDGELVGNIDFVWEVGTTYRLDLSDPTNLNAPLRFSTTPDTSVPNSITEYTDRVIIEGTAGEEGAFVEIEITEDTPNPLYLYADDVGLDTSLIGRGEDGALDVGIKRKGAVFETVRSSILDSDGETVFDFDENTIIGRVAPSELVIPTVTEAERDELPTVQGTLIFNTDSDTLEIFITATGWTALAYV